MTSSLGGDKARVSRSEGEEGDDREEIVEDDREKVRRGGENGWQSQASRKLESTVCGDFPGPCSDLMFAMHVSLQGHVEKESSNSVEGLEPDSDVVASDDSGDSEC